jgi:hypothetical protein
MAPEPRSEGRPIGSPAAGGQPGDEAEVPPDAEGCPAALPDADPEARSFHDHLAMARRLVALELDLAETRRRLAEDNLGITEAQLELAERELEELKAENQRLRRELEALRGR